jgi:hypothetical protein
MIRRLSSADLAYLVCVAALGVATLLPWWLSDLLPLMDYPMFLSFVRVFQDYRDPLSPLSQHFTFGPLLSPLLLPLVLTSAFSKLGSVELGGRLMLSFYSLGMLASSAYLLRALRQSRWNLVLVAPLVFGKWVSSGFFSFFTGVPLLLCCIAVAVCHLERPTRSRSAAVTVLLLALYLWHAMLFGEALITLTVLWLCWRAPSWPERARVLLLALPALIAFALWMSQTSGIVSHERRVGVAFDDLSRVLDPMQFLGCIPMRFVGAERWVFSGLLVLIACRALLPGAPPEAPPSLRVRNPAALLAVVALATYAFAPAQTFGNELFNYRFAWFAALFGAFAWTFPPQGMKKILAIAVVLACAGAWLIHINQRFALFHRETVGASRLIDSIGRHETLFAPMVRTDTRAFINQPIREVQQYAHVRNGSLPNSSFAGYGINIVRFKTTQNPLPNLPARGWERSPKLAFFDYVLLHEPPLPSHSGLHFARRDGDWWLYIMCGGPHRLCDRPGGGQKPL